jgi:hypothetical protein
LKSDKVVALADSDTGLMEHSETGKS